MTMVGYNLSYVLCNGDACSMKNVMIPFIPSLNSSSQVRARLIDDHHRALNPKFSWLVTDPIIGILFGVSILLGVAMALGERNSQLLSTGHHLSSTCLDHHHALLELSLVFGFFRPRLTLSRLCIQLIYAKLC